MRLFTAKQILALSRSACFLYNFRGKKIRKRTNPPTDICFEKENKYLCVYENETHFVLSALDYKYKYLFFPLFIRC